MRNAYDDLAPGSYSRYYLDSLAPYDGLSPHKMLDGPAAVALTDHLGAIQASKGHEVVRLWVGVADFGPVLPPLGWVMLRAHVLVREFDVIVEDLDPLDDDPDEVFDVEVDVEVEILGPDPRGWWPNG